MRQQAENSFREACHRNGLAATHQRYVIYHTLRDMPGHPGPEEIFARVRERIPSISLATVYKSLHAFLEAGIVHEVSLHGGSLRVDPNPEFHHHLICTECRSVTDVPAAMVSPVTMHGKLPAGFRVKHYAVEIQGLCSQCGAGAGRSRRARKPLARRAPRSARRRTNLQS